MPLNALARWLKPREMVFFDLLEGASENLATAAVLFAKGLRNADPVRLAQMRKELKHLEHKGDEYTHEVLDHLDRTFVTPIEREDILALAHAMDDVADCLDAAAERLVLYKIETVLPLAAEMGDLLVQATECLVPLIGSLRSMSDVKGIRRRIVEITGLESQSDTLFHKALALLFDDPQDPVYLMKWKEIFEQLEDAMDRIELVAKVVGSTVMRNA